MKRVKRMPCLKTGLLIDMCFGEKHIDTTTISIVMAMLYKSVL